MFIRSKKNMVYQIPKGYVFMDFIEFNGLDDLGFDSQDLKIEACSRFAFLTLHERTQRMLVNIMLIDPYYDTIQIALF